MESTSLRINARLIEIVRKTDPSTYLRCVASLMPREFGVEINAQVTSYREWLARMEAPPIAAALQPKAIEASERAALRPPAAPLSPPFAPLPESQPAPPRHDELVSMRDGPPRRTPPQRSTPISIRRSHAPALSTARFDILAAPDCLPTSFRGPWGHCVYQATLRHVPPGP